MQIDLEHLHYWMCAIRNSKDPIRTLDAFWKGQISSKEWLIQTLIDEIYLKRNEILNYPVTIDIHGGWVGTLSSLLFQSRIPIKSICSIDIDQTCESIATLMNQKEFEQGRFNAITSDMCIFRSNSDIIINTSCEHITQEQYDNWITGHKNSSLLILQSNNYDIPEHLRIAENLEEFIQQCHVNVIWAGTLNLPLYTRYMIIGKKDV